MNIQGITGRQIFYYRNQLPAKEQHICITFPVNGSGLKISIYFSSKGIKKIKVLNPELLRSPQTLKEIESLVYVS